jgi:hypothetical protein
MQHRVILLHPDAPAKPQTGAPCNGCGWCCAAEPCPLGVLVSGRRHGACTALAWNEEQRVYRCGALQEPSRFVPWLPRAWARRLVQRWIAASRGCDADYEAP